MKEIILLVIGIFTGGLSIYHLFCQPSPPPHVVSAHIIEQKLKEVGDLIFAENQQHSDAIIKIEKDVKIMRQKIASDGVTIKATWVGLHRYGINFENNSIEVDLSSDNVVITVPAYEKRVSFIQNGLIDFKTTNGSWLISKDERYKTALQYIYKQNNKNGQEYILKDSARADLYEKCISSITGILYPLFKDNNKFEVICLHPKAP